MSIVVATTWHPRGETVRLRQLYRTLAAHYDKIIVILPPGTHFGLVLSLRHYEKLFLTITDDWPGGRRTALEYGVDTGADFIQYADMDRLLRWVETRPNELVRTIDRIQYTDCLVIGRTDGAYSTHPQAIVETEAMSNAVFSHMVGMKLDLSAGTKGFRRQAASYILQNSGPGRPFGTDAEWVVLCHRAGFDIDAVLVDGLDWESADRHQERAAGWQQQVAAAKAYDSEAANWIHRVRVADEMIQAGLDAAKRELVMPEDLTS